MTSFAAKVLLLMLSAVLLCGQATVTISGVLPPAPPGINATTIGIPGAGVRCYFVVANYLGGSVVNTATPACVTNAPGTLGVSNYVRVGWTATTGAVSYDVLAQTQQGSFPLGTGCSACAVATGTTATQLSDTGGALTSYTFAGYTPSNPVTIIQMDNIDYILPVVRATGGFGVDAPYFQALPVNPPGTNGVVRLSALQILAGYASSNAGVPTLQIVKNASDTITIGTGVASAVGVAAATDTVTLGVAQILGSGGGALLIGTPTGAANYTTPTAALICAGINGQPVQNMGAGLAATNTVFAATGFEFEIRNQSTGANTITLVAGVGVTLGAGGTTVAQNAFRRWRVVATSFPCTTVTMWPGANGTF